MKKRINRKLCNRHHLLKQATREKHKKKGHKCIGFAIVPGKTLLAIAAALQGVKKE